MRAVEEAHRFLHVRTNGLALERFVHQHLGPASGGGGGAPPAAYSTVRAAHTHACAESPLLEAAACTQLLKLTHPLLEC